VGRLAGEVGMSDGDGADCTDCTDLTMRLLLSQAVEEAVRLLKRAFMADPAHPGVLISLSHFSLLAGGCGGQAWGAAAVCSHLGTLGVEMRVIVGGGAFFWRVFACSERGR